MAGPLFADRVLEVSTTTGTGTYTLGGAVTGYQTWAGVGDGNTGYYYAEEVDADGIPSGGWEVGLGTYTASGTTLARTSVLKSTNSNNAVSWSAGTRRIGNNIPAQILDVLFNPPACGARRSATQAIANATATAIAFTAADDFDTHAMHDPSTDNTKIFAPVAGVYNVTGTFSYAVNGVGLRAWFLQGNGANIASVVYDPVNTIVTSDASLAAQVKLAASGFVELYAYQTSTGSLNVEAGATLQMVYVGRG